MDMDQTGSPLGDALKYLTNYFPCWESETYMVPPSFEFTIEEPEHSESMRSQKLYEKRRGDAAEHNIFELFERFGKDNGQPMFVISKYTFSKYWGSSDGKPSGEHDFLIFHKHFGVALMQVKGVTSEVSENGRNKKINEAVAQLEKDRKMLQDYHDIDVPISRAFVVLPCVSGTNLPCCTDKGYQILCEEDFQSIETFGKTWENKIWSEDFINPLLPEKYQNTVALYAYTMEHGTMVSSIQRSKDKIEDRTKLLLAAAMASETNLEKFEKKGKEKKKIAVKNVYTKEQLKIFKEDPPKLYIDGVAGSEIHELQ